MNKVSKKRICFVFGTRPEAIKLAPLILLLKKKGLFAIEICLTGQHKEMLNQVLEIFEIKADHDLALMQNNQTLVEFASRGLLAIDDYLKVSKPDLVIVHGDTSTALYASLAAFYNKIKIAHIEAGLRTLNKYSPFPEEINRTLVAKLADLHFAPTNLSRQNLIKENTNENTIFVTGNTVIDALFLITDRIKDNHYEIEGIPSAVLSSDAKMILITMHRRENFGDGLKSICTAISDLAKQHQDVFFVYPVHLNPNVIDNVKKVLNNIPNVYLVQPQDYVKFIYLMNRSFLILTDSGGVQEEAPSLGKPILVLRENTERPEALDAGTVKLVGCNDKLIVDTVNLLMSNESEYKKMSEATNPYGDGKASEKIVEVITKKLNA